MAGKTPGGHITVVSKTVWSISHGGWLMDVPAKLLKTIEGHPFLKLASTNYAVMRLLTGSNTGSLPHNASLANNPGLLELKELRNVASGLVLTVAAPEANLLDDDSDKEEEEPPAKQPQKRRKTGTAQSSHCPIVSFELPDYGLIKCARAKRLTEDLVLSMESDVVERTFNFIRDSATDLHAQMLKKRAYNLKQVAAIYS
jgi:hypothetical protein